VSLAEAEAAGVAFAGSMGAGSLAQLRAVPAEELLEATGGWGGPRFPIAVDGHFFPLPPAQVYAEGGQAEVPLLLGWNSEEMGWGFLLGQREPTPAAYREVIRELYPRAADEILALYPGTTRDQVTASATDLAGDRFIALGTWRWFELHRRTGGAPVYRYLFTRPRPPAKASPGQPAATGAVHSAEIEYALGNLDTHPAYAWTEDDHRVSETFRGFVVNFVRAGDPNGPGLPEWPAASAAPEGDSAVMVIDVESRAEPAPHRKRYELLDRLDGPGGE
jgi:para-nitrobenzyl esterase